jgi:cysteine synthase A
VIADSLADCVGATPLVRLARLCQAYGLDGELLVKCEQLNVTGSHKIRAVAAMLDAAERRGDIKRGSGQTLLLATGGNLGKGAALLAAVRGYRLVLVMPDDYSETKISFLKTCGAQVLLADHRTGGNAHGELAMALAVEHPDWLLVNQFNDIAAVHGHRQSAREIIAQLDGVRLDAFVAGVGSAGHLMGIAPILAQAHPAIEIIAVQPAGCDIPAGVFCEHRLQGLAVGAIPPLLDEEIVTRWVSIAEQDAYRTLSELLTFEGLALGISSAATITGALEVAAERPGARVLTVAYDSLSDYPELLTQVTPTPRV